ncbi:MAG: acetyl-CoA carboxylase biotin carboxyl carrier protein subunit [Clostridia bacterium]|nr:acetyl-CoA carboxylase biotin carboxyl carrier protein subunit [Clostridia bacterium]MBP5194299.1 acetyl-CoA carboxylase biotin carboxyl carrier protein subunit [Clostridia bacterium]
MRNFIITIDGKQYEVGVEEVGAAQSPAPAAKAAPAAPVQAAAPAAKPAATPAGGTQMKAPMPGMIAGFKVENGATVKKGQAVLVLEAMKMENDLTAPCDGVITFTVSKGANVDTGAVIATIA